MLKSICENFDNKKSLTTVKSILKEEQKHLSQRIDMAKSVVSPYYYLLQLESNIISLSIFDPIFFIFKRICKIMNAFSKRLILRNQPSLNEVEEKTNAINNNNHDESQDTSKAIESSESVALS